MRTKSIYALLALLLLTAPATAQKKAARPAAARTKTAAVKVDKALQQKIAQLEAVTQKIVFVDSVIVDKQQFLQHYVLNPETGRLGRYDDLFHAKDQANAFACINALGDKCVYASEDTLSNFSLWQADLLNGHIENARPVKGIDTQLYTDINYPFLMGDGVTMYFAAKGPESVGGYDIFVTRYDSDKGEFLKPENIGMPFNSTANDYMYVIDEYGNLGWFATDRGQTAGKVCIYTFVPAATRENYDPTQLSPAQLKAFAAISSIRDTWGDGKARAQALDRLKQIPARLSRKQQRAGDFDFVINDATTYHRYTDFRTTANAARFRTLQEQRSKLKVLGAAIDKARDYYATATAEKRREVAAELLRSEQQYKAYEAGIIQLEKDIRNAENKSLGVK